MGCKRRNVCGNDQAAGSTRSVKGRMMKYNDRQKLDFRYYDMPFRFPFLILSGEEWRREYGRDYPNLHFHNALEIGICYEGKGQILFSGEQRMYKSGTITVVPAGVPHNTYNDRGDYSLWSWIYIDVENLVRNHDGGRLNFPEKLIRHVNSWYFVTETGQDPVMKHVLDLIIQEKEQKEEYHSEMIMLMIYQLLLLIGRKNADSEEKTAEVTGRNMLWLRSLMQFVEDNYQNQITVQDMADTIHVSESYFRLFFRENMKASPLEYLNQIRISHACSFLEKTDLSIEAVSERTGFTTISTFHRNFRKYVGMSPLKWRKLQKERDNETRFIIKPYKGWI